MLIEEALVKPSFPKITGHSDNWGNSLTIWMAEQGFKKLGMGAYGHVFKHPNLSYVLKVYIDEGYDKWIEICRKLKDNPYVPVFRGKPFKVGPFSVIRMENLKPLEDENNYDLSKSVDSYLRGVISNNKFKKLSKDSSVNEKSWEDYFGKDHALFTDKKLKQVTDKLIKFFDKNSKYKVDLAYSNFMERNGKLVIIDPIAYASYPAKSLILTDKHYSKQSEKASEEASIDTLFHSTDPAIALKALKEGSFLLPLSETNNSEKFISWLDKNGIRKNVRRNAPKLFYLSFARTPASGYIADRGQGLSAVNHSVLFVVNGRELRTHNRETVFAPTDYWYNSDDTGRQNGAAKEAEERLFSANPKVKFLKSLIEIRIFAKDSSEKTHAALRKLILYCKKNDIKLKLFSSSNKPGFLLGKENPDDRALALKIILSKTDKSKPWPISEREPLSDLKFLVDLIEKQSYYDLSEKQRSSLYYYLQDNPVYGDLAKHFDSTIHNLRSGRESDKTFLYDVLKRNKIKSIDEMFQMLQSKWTKLRDKYNEEEERKYQEEYKKRTEAASLEELALFKANIPDVTNRKWRANLTKWAKSKGFKAIGKGKYGKVFYSELKPNIVIKVFSDASYKFWYKIAVENKSNPCAPKFFGKPVKIADGLWAVRMEKLEPLNSTQKVATWMIETFTKFHAKENYGISTASNFKKVTHADVHDIRKTVITDDMEELLMDLLWNLSKGENSLKYALDLHAGNFMRRGDTIVLVDPLQNVTELLRSMFKIDRPTTHEDAMADMSHLDVLSYVPKKEEPKVEEAAVVEIADPNVNNRKTFMTMPGVKRVLIGPVKGPLIPVMYSEETRMFFPVFKE